MFSSTKHGVFFGILSSLLLSVACGSEPRTFEQGVSGGGSGGSGGATGGSREPLGGGPGEDETEVAGSGGESLGAAAGGAGGMPDVVSAAGEAGAGGQAVVLRPFSKGPCVAATGEADVEAFARASDEKVYRRVLSAVGGGSWTALAHLDASVVDVRSDLDCSADAGSTSTSLVATSNQPVGAYLLSDGTGDSFNPFLRQLAPLVFLRSVSVSRRTLVGVQGDVMNVAQVQGTDIYWLPSPTESPRLSSPASVTEVSAFNSVITAIAAFDDNEELVLLRYQNTSTFSGWSTEDVRLPPPAGKKFQFAPAICHDYFPNSGGPYPQRHLVAVADGKLWYRVAKEFDYVFTPWESLGDQTITTTPDCTAEADGTVHVVALGTDGNVLHVHGTSGDFVVEDLGGY